MTYQNDSLLDVRLSQQVRHGGAVAERIDRPARPHGGVQVVLQPPVTWRGATLGHLGSRPGHEGVT